MTASVEALETMAARFDHAYGPQADACEFMNVSTGEERCTPSRPSQRGRLPMREHLVFVLCAPMGAFGSYAGHERRGSDLVPPRSAILSLLGTTLGIDRTDADGQAALSQYRAAARPLTHSIALRDYLTVQPVPAKIKHPSGRRAAIDAIGRGITTRITIRDYRTDVAIAVAVWGQNERGPWRRWQRLDDEQRRPGRQIDIPRPLLHRAWRRVGANQLAIVEAIARRGWQHGCPVSDPCRSGQRSGRGSARPVAGSARSGPCSRRPSQADLDALSGQERCP